MIASSSGVENLISVPIESFRQVTRDISFDVYIRISDGNFAHIFSRSTGLDYKRLASYIQKGVTELYIQSEDKPLYDMFVSRTAEVIINDPALPNEKKIAALLNMTEQNMSEIFAQIEVREETVEDTKKLVNHYAELMTQSPQSLTVILKLVSHGEYLYYHSIAVSIFSLFIGKATGQFDQKTLEEIGMGAFLHDIGCTQLPKDVIDCTTVYTPDQRKTMEKHAKLGLQMLLETGNVPDPVKYIVYQHHEEPGGGGYPNRISSSKLYYPARVVALADAFSAMISKRPFRPAFTVEQAIKILREKKNKFDPKLVELLASIILPAERSKRAA